MISEGWDYPEPGILVMARPTLSRALYLQQLGRGLRKTDSKQNVFVTDVVDEYGTMAAPCSLHSIFQNPCYVPFGDILRRDYDSPYNAETLRDRKYIRQSMLTNPFEKF